MFLVRSVNAMSSKVKEAKSDDYWILVVVVVMVGWLDFFCLVIKLGFSGDPWFHLVAEDNRIALTRTQAESPFLLMVPGFCLPR